MGRIEKEIEICGINGCQKVRALFDTGADMTVIDRQIADRIGVRYVGSDTFAKIADGSRIKLKQAEIKGIQIDSLKRENERVVIGDIGKDVLIGNQFMQNNGIKLDFEKDKIKLGESDIWII